MATRANNHNKSAKLIITVSGIQILLYISGAVVQYFSTFPGKGVWAAAADIPLALFLILLVANILLFTSYISKALKSEVNLEAGPMVAFGLVVLLSFLFFPLSDWIG
jgi:hypothetical protein